MIGLSWIFWWVLAWSAPAGADLRVQVEGFRSNEGSVRVAVFASAGGFPDDGRRSFRRASAPVRNRRAVLTFENLPPGRYAVTLLHDENNDGEMNNTFVGIPKEGYGFSKIDKKIMARPSFAETAVAVRADTTIRISVQYF